MDVAKVNPFKLVSISCILGIGNATLCSFEFKTLKSDTTLTVPFFFGMMKDGDWYSEATWGFKTPKSHRRCISFFSVASCILGTENGASWKGLAPSLSLKLTGSVFQSPSVPSNKCSNF